jgi:Predicted transcription regulator containing HTH domain
MQEITEKQYEYALDRIEELLPLVDGYGDPTQKEAVELSLLSDVVIEYEKVHFPIEKPTPSELISLALEESGISQKDLASQIGVSPSRISDYVTGRAEPTLRIAARLCSALGISPAAMMGM